jgi:uncharacterized protein (TIGR02145 family)
MKNLFSICLLSGLLFACGTENVPVYDFVASAMPQEGGVINPSSGQFSDGSSVEIRAIPFDGWEFIRWEGDLTQTLNPTTIRINRAVSVVGIFQKRETFEVLSPATGRIWMDRNLGATRVAVSLTDSLAYGDLYQWGRGADDHQKRTSFMISTLSNTDQPRIDLFILAPNFPHDWRSPQNHTLWQGLDGINNPCPLGFRLPTQEEWEAERASWISSDVTGAFASFLKLPPAGRRNYSEGPFYDVDKYGYYWSSTVDGAFSRGLGVFDLFAGMFSYNRAGGNSVRCIKA